MSERSNSQVLPPAELLTQRGLVVPDSVRAAGERGGNGAVPAAPAEVALDSAAPVEVSTSHDTGNNVGRPYGETEGPHPDDLDNLLGGAFEYDDGAGTGDDAAAASSAAATASVRSHRAPRDLSKLRYLNPVEAARLAKVKWENAKTRWKEMSPAERMRFGGRAGAVALGAAAVVGGTYMIYKGYSSDAPAPTGTWHEGSSGLITAEQPAIEPAAAETSIPTERPEVPGAQTSVTENDPDYSYRQATGQDISGRASNVTDWSRQAIYEEAIEGGLTKKQAHTLANDQENISRVSKAFYTQNESVANDANHYMNAGDMYETTGQHNTADNIVDKFKAENGIDQPKAVTESEPAAPAEPKTEPAAKEAAPPTTTESSPAPIPETTPVKDEGAHPALATAATTLVAGVGAAHMAITTEQHATAYLSRRDRETEEAEARMTDDINNAVSAGREPEDIVSHRAEERRHRRGRTGTRRRGRRQPVVPAHPAVQRTTLPPSENGAPAVTTQSRR